MITAAMLAQMHGTTPRRMRTKHQPAFHHPYGQLRQSYEQTESMTTDTKTKTRKRKRGGKSRKEKQRLQAKAQSPGVPPNTCPYIDITLTMIDDLADAYDKMYTKGEHSPTAHRIAEQARDMLELVRTTNETLRDNSAYWYNRYKDTL